MALPPGAAPPTVLKPSSPTSPNSTRPGLHPGMSQATTVTYQNDNDSPPGTPRQKLLDVPSQESSRSHSPHVQYATYPEEKDEDANPRTQMKVKPWVPYPLRPWFWIPFVCILVLGAIGLEVALHFSNKNNGWNTASSFSTDQAVLHYVYTLPPVAVAAIITAMWTWTDYEIKKMQPYVDLSHGDSPPQRSLLLDYTRSNNFFAFPKATKNRHYVVALASLMVILTLIFQPLAAALLEVRQTWWSLPSMDLTQMKQVGLNQNQEFGDLSAFLSAAGFASASIMYQNLPSPPFIHNEYTVAPFQLPSTDTSQGGIEANGTILFANSTAVKSFGDCQPVQPTMTQLDATSGSWANSIDSNGCVLNWTVTRESEFLFGTNTTLCSGSDTPTQFAPIAFWFFSYNPTPRASATVCRPRIELWDVTFQMELASQNITLLKELQPFSTNSNFSSASGNITGAPLNGRAYNGISFNLTTPVDPFVEARRSAIQLQLPASVFQLAREKPGGLETSFDLNVFVQLSTQVYVTYLTLLASTVYFVSPPSQEINTVQAKTVMNRVFLSSTAVHLLTVALLLLAFFCTLIQLFHRWDRRALNLPRAFEPGTIASAVSVGAQTGMGELLAEVREKTRYRDEDVIKVLGQKKFRIDPDTMKIVMEGEEGYEWARSPNRRSAFFPSGEGGVGARLSRRLSAWGGVNGDGERSKSPLSAIPASPKTPKSPQAQRTGGGEV